MPTDTAQDTTIPKAATPIKRTSVNLPADLWADLRIAAIRRDITAGAAIESAIRLWVGQELDAA